ncbi:hypothetical protein H4R20_004660 [Coemansia guatemalensis]|uniref:Uncharacterized protein n=1 Tax=Coemansia guatemalensis TaxID=2761395 RepID=A0A9W8LSK6_9FUNG|nr:hypothetical protein H4R20_004660 [Coemansia guatemalensis]
MGRKRGSSSRKSRSKRSSSNTSTATSPTNTPASFAAAASEPPPSSVPEEPKNSQPDNTVSPEAGEAQDKEDSAPVAVEEELKVEADLDNKNVEEQPSEDAPVAAADRESLSPRTDAGQPEIPADATAKDELADNRQYNIDVKSAVEAFRCDTEDLLDDLYTYPEEDTNRPEADVDEQLQHDVGDEQVVASTQDPTSDSARAVEENTEQISDGSVQADTSGSQNLEDSEAVLLASDLENSIYRSVVNDRTVDELHAVENSQESESTEIHHENAADVVYSAINVASRSKESREYVVTPSAFATDSEPNVVAHVNQESAAHAFDADADAAAAMVSIMSDEVYAAARAGDMETSARSGGDSSANEWQMSESYVRVSQDLNSGK